MTSDFESIPSIAYIASGKTAGGELIFTFPEVLQAIRLCSSNSIAVLGVEILEMRSDGHVTKRLSQYDQHLKTRPQQMRDWTVYLKENNARAHEFISENPVGDDHVYVLTTSSWREFSSL